MLHRRLLHKVRPYRFGPDAPFLEEDTPRRAAAPRPDRGTAAPQPGLSASEEAESRRRWSSALAAQRLRRAVTGTEKFALGLYAAAFAALMGHEAARRGGERPTAEGSDTPGAAPAAMSGHGAQAATLAATGPQPPGEPDASSPATTGAATRAFGTTVIPTLRMLDQAEAGVTDTAPPSRAETSAAAHPEQGMRAKERPLPEVLGERDGWSPPAGAEAGPVASARAPSATGEPAPAGDAGAAKRQPADPSPLARDGLAEKAAPRSLSKDTATAEARGEPAGPGPSAADAGEKSLPRHHRLVERPDDPLPAAKSLISEEGRASKPRGEEVLAIRDVGGHAGKAAQDGPAKGAPPPARDAAADTGLDGALPPQGGKRAGIELQAAPDRTEAVPGKPPAMEPPPGAVPVAAVGSRPEGVGMNGPVRAGSEGAEKAAAAEPAKSPVRHAGPDGLPPASAADPAPPGLAKQAAAPDVVPPGLAKQAAGPDPAPPGLAKGVAADLAPGPAKAAVAELAPGPAKAAVAGVVVDVASGPAKAAVAELAPGPTKAAADDPPPPGPAKHAAADDPPPGLAKHAAADAPPPGLAKQAAADAAPPAPGTDPLPPGLTKHAAAEQVPAKAENAAPKHAPPSVAQAGEDGPQAPGQAARDHGAEPHQGPPAPGPHAEAKAETDPGPPPVVAAHAASPQPGPEARKATSPVAATGTEPAEAVEPSGAGAPQPASPGAGSGHGKLKEKESGAPADPVVPAATKGHADDGGPAPGPASPHGPPSSPDAGAALKAAGLLAETGDVLPPGLAKRMQAPTRLEEPEFLLPSAREDAAAPPGRAAPQGHDAPPLGGSLAEPQGHGHGGGLAAAPGEDWLI